MSMLLLFNPTTLNPSPVGASPFAGAAGSNAGILHEVPKGAPTIYVAAPTTSALRVVASNPDRRSLTVVNAHATVDVYIGFSSALTAATGFYVPAKTIFPFALDRWTGEIWAITSASTSDVRAIETVSN